MLTNNKPMSDNMSLIDGINKQRDFNKKLKNEVQSRHCRIRQIAQRMDLKQKKNSVTGNPGIQLPETP